MPGVHSRPRFDSRPQIFEIDVETSAPTFRVRRIFTEVTGQFRRFSGTLNWDGEPATSSVEVTIEVESLDSGDEERDRHLMGKHFFDVEHYPTIHFVSTDVIEEEEENRLRVRGDLTIRDITRSIDLEATVLGFEDGAPQRGRFQIVTMIHRREFGVTGQSLPNAFVSDEIHIEFEVGVVARPA